MYDLHTHTVLSDGVLIPSELVRRYEAAGYKGIVIADHVDAGTIETVVSQIVRFVEKTQPYFPSIQILPGCELTHLPLGMYADMTKRARELGAKVVIAHGETIVEPVQKGVNREAIEAGVDIIAHPGLIEEECVSLAKQKGVVLEITSRAGHSYTNGHVVQLARKVGAQLVYSSDFHEPKNLLSHAMVMSVLHGAGLHQSEIQTVLGATKNLFISKKES